MIANTAQDVRDPQRTLPRAYYSSVGFVIVLYVLVAIITVGSLPLDAIVGARDYALAEAARPSLGQTGFLLIAIAAVLSTASAMNATIYGAARLSYVIAKDGELPELLERKAWGRPVEGLLITSTATLLLANFIDLSSLSTMGSAGFLLIFSAVNGANAKLSRETWSSKWLSLVGVGLCLAALISLLAVTVTNAPGRLWILFIMAGGAFSLEFAYRLATGRVISLPNNESRK